MTRTSATILLCILATGLVLVAASQSGPDTGGGFYELRREEVAGSSDLEVVMGIIERPGESTSAKHHHPGGEFGFVLEGALIVAAQGEPEATLGPGASFYQPPGEWHVVATSAEGAKTIVFRVQRKGEPMVVPIE